jgi:plasmid stability protein
MKTLWVRNVPDDLHRALKERARHEGTTMSELVRRELPRIVNRPTPEQLLARLRLRSEVGGAPAAELIAAERAARAPAD